VGRGKSLDEWEEWSFSFIRAWFFEGRKNFLVPLLTKVFFVLEVNQKQ
jgi:hypothetical protein